MKIEIKPPIHTIWTRDAELKRVESACMPEFRKLKTPPPDWQQIICYSQKDFLKTISKFMTAIEFRLMFDMWPHFAEPTYPSRNILFSCFNVIPGKWTETTRFINYYKCDHKSTVTHNLSSESSKPLTRTMMSILTRQVLAKDADTLLHKYKTVFSYLNRYPHIDTLLVAAEIACSNDLEFFYKDSMEGSIDGAHFKLSYKPRQDK